MILTNLSSVHARHRWLEREHDRLVTSVLERSEDFAYDHVANHAEFTHRTRKTLEATKAKTIRTKGGKLLRIKNETPVALFLEYGTKPHTIKPKSSTHLRFYWKRMGRWVSSKQIDEHPGTRPYKFLYRAQRATYRVIGPNLNNGMRKLSGQF